MIAMNDFRAEPAELHAAMLEAARRVIASGRYILGPEVEAFERRWAQACGVEHAVGVGNGMDAIEIGLRALGIGPGDEVVTTTMSAFATVLAILRCGATPVLADVEAGTALLSPPSVQRCITSRTRALVLVHLYGQVRGMDAWVALCRDRSIHLVEDCAQSHLAAARGTVAGAFGAAGAYSFYPTKNLGAVGDGGMLVTRDGRLAEVARVLRNYGQTGHYRHDVEGLNSRLDEIHAAMLSEKLAWLDRFCERRRQVAEAYHDGIRNSRVRLLERPEERAAHVYHLFVVACEERDRLAQHLAAQGIQTLVHYPTPIHRQPPCLESARDTAGLANAERHAATCLSLPCHPQMTDAQVAEVVAAVNSFPG